MTRQTFFRTIARLRAVVVRRALDRQLDEELDSHLELPTDEYVRRGVDRERARQQALRSIGSLSSARERHREARGVPWIETFARDLRYGVRHLRRSPAFTAIAVLTLAIGIGASTAIFTQVNAVFWKPLPVDRPDQLRTLVWTSSRPGFVLGPNVIPGPRLPDIGNTYGSFSYIAYLAMRDAAASLADLACWLDIGEQRPIVMGELGFGSVQFVSGNYFRMLGLGAAIGRTILPDDDRRGSASPVAVLSDRFWRRAFGADPDVVNRTVVLNGRRFAIVGVTPVDFFGLDPSTAADVMVPIGTIQIAAATTNPLENPGIWIPCRVVGRIPSRVADDRLRGATEAAVRDAILAHPPTAPYEMPRIWTTAAGRGLDTLRTATETPLLVLMAVVAGLVSIACANIAGLLLARGTARRKEIATRLALGASRSRLVCQLLTESLVLSLAGAAAGVWLAYFLRRPTSDQLARLMPTLYGASRTIGVNVAPDWRVLLFSSALAILTGLAFGLAPALQATRPDLVSVIKLTSAAGSRRFASNAGKLMVMLQAALAMLLLVEAGLFVRTIVNLRSVPLGFKPEGLIYLKAEPRTGGIGNDRRDEFFENAINRLERIPGVVSASAALRPPMTSTAGVGMMNDTLPVCVPGQVPSQPGTQTAGLNVVAPRFFETLGLPLVAGRDLEWRDRFDPQPAAPLVAVVNDAFVKRFYRGRNAVGEKLGFNCPARPDQVTVVGVVADSRTLPRRELSPIVYLPFASVGDSVTLVVRTASGGPAMIQTLRRAMAEFNASVPVFGEITPLELREQQIRQERLLADLLVAFGAVALSLACLGIYGTLTYSVTRRSREIGLRVALGARRADVVRMVVGESLEPVAAGIGLGLLSAFAVTRGIDSFLFGVSKHDPLTIAGAATTFILVGTAAALLPALRASRIDPVVALRSE